MKITKAHWTAAVKSIGTEWDGFYTICNKAIEIAQADAEQSEYITAEQARALGTGKAEYSHPVMRGDWDICGDTCGYPVEMYGEFYKYRVIKQPESVDPHTELKAMYEQQVKDGTRDNFVWEYLDGQTWIPDNGFGFSWFKNTKYRCTPKPTCKVQLVGEPVRMMTRDAARALQTETKDTHDWFDGDPRVNAPTKLLFIFDMNGIYKYRPKAKKQISWADMPIGVRTNKGELRGTCGSTAYVEEVTTRMFIGWHGVKDLTLAPASDQPWLNWRGGECPVPEGVIVEVTLRVGYTSATMYYSCEWEHNGSDSDIIEYRIVGIESGYVLGGGGGV